MGYITRHFWRLPASCPEAHVRAKTTFLMVHKDAIPAAIRQKLGIKWETKRAGVRFSRIYARFLPTRYPESLYIHCVFQTGNLFCSQRFIKTMTKKTWSTLVSMLILFRHHHLMRNVSPHWRRPYTEHWSRQQPEVTVELVCYIGVRLFRA
jgi:hypothetical protein